MRICFDLDGVICALRQPGENYSDLLPIPGARERLESLKQDGHYIILHTARHMKTCEGNVGRVINRVGKITLEWLERHAIPYDEIYFGKPWADLYVDDNAFRFESWHSFTVSNFPENRESAQAREALSL